MCWSWQVSLCFTLFEFSCIIWLVYRNKFVDRTLAFLALSVACQEFCQFLIWGFGIDNNTTKYNCSIFNQVVSVFLFLFITSLPTCYLSCLYFATYNLQSIAISSINTYIDNNRSDNNTNNNETSVSVNMYDVVFKALVATSFVFLFVAIIYYGVYFGIFSNHAPCTYISDSGHQVWQFGDSNLPTLQWCMEIIYFLLICVCAFIFRPGWVILPSIGNTAICFIILKSTMPDYTNSRWCWEAGFNCIWYIMTPYVAQWIINYFEKHNLNISSSNYHDLDMHWSMKWVFIGTKQLFDNTNNINHHSEDNFDYTEIKGSANDYDHDHDHDEQV